MEMYEWKRISTAKVKPTSQEKRLLEWKEYFKNLFRNLLKIIEKPLKSIIKGQMFIML